MLPCGTGTIYTNYGFVKTSVDANVWKLKNVVSKSMVHTRQHELSAEAGHTQFPPSGYILNLGCSGQAQETQILSSFAHFPPGHAPCLWRNDEETPRHRGIKIEEKSYISVVRRKGRTRWTWGHREVVMVEAMGPGPALRPH